MFMQDITRLAPAVPVAAPALTCGLAAGTPVETRGGWRPVESLRRGDLVHTLDGGLRPVLAVDRFWLMGVEAIALPGGAFGNDDAVTLLPGQYLLTDLTRADAGVGGLPDALAVLLPAMALAALPGAVGRRIGAPVQVVTPLFAEEEYVWAAAGLIFRCPSVADGPGSLPEREGVFPRLDPGAARRLIAARAQEAG